MATVMTGKKPNDIKSLGSPQVFWFGTRGHNIGENKYLVM
jgi:hypothetical protein